MADDLVIVGAGGFGRETAALVRAVNEAAPSPVWNVVGLLDDGDPPVPGALERLGLEVIGPTASVVDHPNYVISINQPSVRERISRLADDGGSRAATLVHPTALIGPDVQIGEGCIVSALTAFTTNIRIGRHVQINIGAAFGHDCVVEDFAYIGTRSIINGEVVVGAGATVWTGVDTKQGVSIGARAVVGAGAALIRDVAADDTVAGVPGRSLAR